MKSNNSKRDRKDSSNNYLGLQKFPSIESLKLHAEEEFRKEFHKHPTYATLSPGCFNIAGEVSNFNDGKALCMAIQLSVVVVGRKRNSSKWCCVKTLSEEIEESNIYKFYLNTNGLEITKKSSWINYIKGAIKSYKAARVSHPIELIPGFNIVIASSIPIKTGLCSSTALTLAIYTFLEAITNIYTINNFEKAIACNLAEKFVTKKSNFVGESLASVIGCNEKILEIDTRTLEVAEHKWDPKNIEWIFIQLPHSRSESSDYEKYLAQCREIAFATNMSSFRDVTIEDLSKLEPYFPETFINVAKHIINENNRVSRIVKFIEERTWKKLGETLWESYFSSKSNVSDYDSEVERIMKTLQGLPGILGAKVIGHKFVGRILVLVRREAVEGMIKALKNISNPEYYILQPASGVKILYSDEYVLCKGKTCSEHAKITAKYHLGTTESFSHYYMHRKSL